MQVLRHEIWVDDRLHTRNVGQILHVAARVFSTVEIWALDAGAYERQFQVFGTGQPLPDDDFWTHVGSAESGPFIWHLFEYLAHEERPGALPLSTEPL